MSPSRTPRISFTPEALRKYEVLCDDVWDELEKDGLVETYGDGHICRTQLAKGVFRLAAKSWTDIQMRQLLVRALRMRQHDGGIRVERLSSTPTLIDRRGHTLRPQS